MTERCEEMLHPILPIAAQAKSACRGTEACAAALAKALAGHRGLRRRFGKGLGGAG